MTKGVGFFKCMKCSYFIWLVKLLNLNQRSPKISFAKTLYELKINLKNIGELFVKMYLSWHHNIFVFLKLILHICSKGKQVLRVLFSMF